NNLQRRLENLRIVQSDRLPVYLLCRFGLFALPLLFPRLLVRQTDPDLLLGQVHDVPDGSLHGKVASQILVDGLRLRRRFHNNQRTCHFPFVTPDSLAPRALRRGLCPSRYLNQDAESWLADSLCPENPS